MKILLLNPHIDAWRNILRAWQASGDVVFLPENPIEAWQLLQLHGPSLDLVIAHREHGGQNSVGLKFIEKMKALPGFVDLPLIITSEQWKDTEFAKHQQTPQGANAYLHCPPTLDAGFKDQLFTTINAIFGLDDPMKAAEPGSPALSSSLSGNSGPIVLEDANSIYSPEPTTASVMLEAPELEPEHEPQLTPPPLLETPAPEAPELASSLTSFGKIELAVPFDLPNETQDPPQDGPVLLQRDPVFLKQQPAFEDEPKLHSPEEAEQPETPDAEAIREMPYLFGKINDRKGETPSMRILFAEPVGDAIIPGGAAQSPDVETLKKYLQLREKDVAVLSTQLKSARDQIQSMEQQLLEARTQNKALSDSVEAQTLMLEEARRAADHEMERIQGEVNDMRFQMKAKADKAKLLEIQVREAAEEMERLKERVRVDIRKIRIREKELENKLEIMRKDSEVLISARENKIVELKRKLDILEFNMDLLQDRYAREKENSAKLRERLSKAAQVVKVAGGFLDSSGNPVPTPDAEPAANPETAKDNKISEAS